MLPPPQSALAWADRLYARVAPLPKENPSLGIGRALDAYRQIARRYPRSRAHVGVGECLMLLGRYPEATYAYGPSPRAREARCRAMIVVSARRLAPGRRIVQVERVPGSTTRWIALVARVRPAKLTKDDWEAAEVAQAGMLCLQWTPEGVRRIGPERPLVRQANPYEDDPPRTVTLYVSRLTGHGSPVAISYADWPGADNDTNEQRLLRIAPTRLEPVGRFFGKWTTAFDPPTASHGLLATVTATWKVWWPDVYEWRGGRFVFANRLHPERYPERDWRYADPDDRLYYPARMQQAALDGIHGRWRQALRAWQEAARICRLTQTGDRGQGNGYRDFGLYGDTQENLREIRRRIRWIQQGDYDHALLYRPYDFDLQVPPYRLGRARAVQEKRGDF